MTNTGPGRLQSGWSVSHGLNFLGGSLIRGWDLHNGWSLQVEFSHDAIYFRDVL